MEVRGEGLLLGPDPKGPEIAKEVFEKCLEEGVLVNLIGGTTIRLALPLTVTKTEIRHCPDPLLAAVDEVAGVPFGALAEPQG